MSDEKTLEEKFNASRSALDKINAQWDLFQLKLSQPITATIDTTGVSRFDISILDIHPGDVIVIKMTQQMPRVEIDSLKRNVSMALPDHEIIVLLDGIELSVMRQKE